MGRFSADYFDGRGWEGSNHLLIEEYAPPAFTDDQIQMAEELLSAYEFNSLTEFLGLYGDDLEDFWDDFREAYGATH